MSGGGEDLSYSSDFDGLEEAYLGEGGVNFSAEAREGGDSDLENMFADLAAAQEGNAEGGKRKAKAKAKAKSKAKAKAKKAGRKTTKSTSKSASRTSGGDAEAEEEAEPVAEPETKPVVKATKPKAASKAAKPKEPKEPKEHKEKSEFVHYTMVLADGKEAGDYRVRRGKQGPAAAAAKAATRYRKLKNISNDSGKFTIKIRQTTHGQGHNKTFEYTVEYKKVKASPAFEKMTGQKTIYRQHIISV